MANEKPTLEEFIFQDINNERVNISIKTYGGKRHAIEMFNRRIYDPSKFKLL